MRDATREEQQTIQKNVDKISTPTGVNFWDFIDDYFNKTKCSLKLKTCHDCEYRHGCCYPAPYERKKCKYWKLGKCYVCKYYKLSSLMTEEETDAWYKRGCEGWFPTGMYCKNFKRSWKATIIEFINNWRY